eukprot:1155363-Pelagomonas_calceolata.AAC.2
MPRIPLPFPLPSPIPGARVMLLLLLVWRALTRVSVHADAACKPPGAAAAAASMAVGHAGLKGGVLKEVRGAVGRGGAPAVARAAPTAPHATAVFLLTIPAVRQEVAAVPSCPAIVVHPVIVVVGPAVVAASHVFQPHAMAVCCKLCIIVILIPVCATARPAAMLCFAAAIQRRRMSQGVQGEIAVVVVVVVVLLLAVKWLYVRSWQRSGECAMLLPLCIDAGDEAKGCVAHRGTRWIYIQQLLRQLSTLLHALVLTFPCSTTPTAAQEAIRTALALQAHRPLLFLLSLLLLRLPQDGFQVLCLPCCSPPPPAAAASALAQLRLHDLCEGVMEGVVGVLGCFDQVLL